MGPKAATVTGAIMSTGTTTPPNEFAKLTKVGDGSYTIQLFSLDFTIIEQSYELKLLFTEISADGICQPNPFKIQVKCTPTIDCSASMQSNVTYLLT